MRWFYALLFPAIWIGYLVYWQILSSNVKATERLEPASSRGLRSVLFLTAVALLSMQQIPVAWLYRSLLSAGLWTFWGGAVITVSGLLFSIWARHRLGRNWSRSVTIKKDHELITSGPYALARHPIYTGLLTAFLGTALAITQVRGVLALTLVFVALWMKLRLEEQWMREQFGEQYDVYARRVAAVVPFLL